MKGMGAILSTQKTHWERMGQLYSVPEMNSSTLLSVAKIDNLILVKDIFACRSTGDSIPALLRKLIFSVLVDVEIEIRLQHR